MWRVVALLSHEAEKVRETTAVGSNPSTAYDQAMTDDAQPQEGLDLSGLHREIDRLKAQLCRCHHEGTCVACKGFEVVRQQGQAVAAAASQPVLMQVAQEAAVKDMLAQLGGLQAKLATDPQLAELMTRMAERVQEDLGGPEALEEMLKNMGFMSANGRSPFDDMGRPASGDSPFDAFAKPDEPPDPPAEGGPAPKGTPPA